MLDWLNPSKIHPTCIYSIPVLEWKVSGRVTICRRPSCKVCCLPCLISNTWLINVLLCGTSLAKFRITSPRNFCWVVSSAPDSSHNEHSSWLFAGSFTDNTNSSFQVGSMVFESVLEDVYVPVPPPPVPMEKWRQDTKRGKHIASQQTYQRHELLNTQKCIDA